MCSQRAHFCVFLGHAVPKLDAQQMEQVETFLVQQMVCSPHVSKL